ncbi:O-antigen ligase family protein [Cupriavidus necator]|uniref:O-antigen ligase family protein n=1 Tax=Cupriavidus necator TaxID=106590 RepID=UPI001E473883|nr:O-antigen ligase family protein [Cupriavidus necator]
MAVAGYCSSIVKTRVTEAFSNIAAFSSQTGLDTSEGWRLQLWKASLNMLQSHPLTGVGPEGFSPAWMRWRPAALSRRPRLSSGTRTTTSCIWAPRWGCPACWRYSPSTWCRPFSSCAMCVTAMRWCA